MKKLVVVMIAGVLLASCAATQTDPAVKKSLTNINDELVNMQKTITDMQVAMEDLDRKLAAASESQNTNADAIAALKSELNYLNNELMAVRGTSAMPNTMKPAQSATPAAKEPMMDAATDDAETTESTEMAPAADMADSGQQIIIIEDSSTDKSTMYSNAYELYKQKKFVEAEAQFNDFLQKFPSDDLSDNALYWIAEIQYTQDKLDIAIDKFRDLVKAYPKGNKLPDALYKIALIHDTQDRRNDSVATLKQLIKKYPDTRAAGLAKKKLAEWKLQ